MNANEFAFNHLKEQLPLVVPQIVLSCGQIMGDSSAEVVNKAAEHDYMSVIEQLVMASSTHSVFQADDAKDALRASAGLFMMDDWREGVRLQTDAPVSDINTSASHPSTVLLGRTTQWLNPQWELLGPTFSPQWESAAPLIAITAAVRVRYSTVQLYYM